MEEILAKIEAGEPLPEGVERLVEIVEDPGAGEPVGSGDTEVYFPLPANEEQLEISSDSAPTRAFWYKDRQEQGSRTPSQTS
jgi:hypothetical protein